MNSHCLQENTFFGECILPNTLKVKLKNIYVLYIVAGAGKLT